MTCLGQCAGMSPEGTAKGSGNVGRGRRGGFAPASQNFRTGGNVGSPCRTWRVSVFVFSRHANSRRSLPGQSPGRSRASGVGEGSESKGALAARLAGVARDGDVALRSKTAPWPCARLTCSRAWLQLVCVAVGGYPPPCRRSDDPGAKNSCRTDQSPVPPHARPAPRYPGWRRRRNPAGVRRRGLRGWRNLRLLLAVHAAQDRSSAAAAALGRRRHVILPRLTGEGWPSLPMSFGALGIPALVVAFATSGCLDSGPSRRDVQSESHTFARRQSGTRTRSERSPSSIK